MDFELPADDDPRRLAVRAWLTEHPRPSGRQLAEAGYVAPHWPRPWGLDADPIHQLIIDDELATAGVNRPANPIGIGWAGPTILYAGTEEQKDRYLSPLLSGQEIWCQLFSEPGSGSDLASLGTRAVRAGRVDHQRSEDWTSGASQFARHPIARTDPTSRSIRASRTSSARCTCRVSTFAAHGDDGRSAFNEVFFTDVRIPAENRSVT